MLDDHTIAAVVPAYNEEKLIGRVIETMPDFVDRIIVVDDYSHDSTREQVRQFASIDSDRVVLIEHQDNQGVGSAIATGYVWCRDHEIDVAVVMAGDAQMDPADLPNLLGPVISGEADYTKGNRLFTGDAWKIIPRVRYLGNSVLSLLTKIASGYWHIADSQAGYTAINLRALKTIDWDQMYKRYGQPNDLLVRLNIYSFRVRDVPVRPVYNIGEDSGINPIRIIPKLSWLLFKLFLYRMVQKYVIRDFHPLVFFYGLAGLLLFLCLPLLARLIWFWAADGVIPKINALALMFSGITGLQSLFFAMWFDMESNRSLR
jgi:glycosyltransferase involved in cell wall biosynthesis